MNKYFLGKNKDGERYYMEDFSWDCGWYWAGGYIKIYGEYCKNWNTHTHFDNFGDNSLNLFDKVKKEIPELNITDDDLWRLCDLMTQFYAHKESAECFQYGGHYTSEGRTKKEINKAMADKINKHIELVIIPEVRKLLGKYKA